MNQRLKQFSEIVAKANDLFAAKYQNIDTLMGIMDKVLRKQGMEADAVTLDCISQNKKIVFLLHDVKPAQVEFALGNKDGDIFSSSDIDKDQLTTGYILKIMEENFTHASAMKNGDKS